MSTLIADALVWLLPAGGTLAGYRAAGTLRREWALMQAMLEHYPRVIVASTGDEEEVEALQEVVPDTLRDRVCVVFEPEIEPNPITASVLAERVALLLGEAKQVVCRASEVRGSFYGIDLVHELRSRGHVVAFVARTTEAWTRFIAHETGPHAEEAVLSGTEEGTVCQISDMLIGTTPVMVSDLAWRYTLDPRNTAVVPNYATPVRDNEIVQERIKGLLLYAGPLVARTRVDTLIQAVAMLHEAHPEIVLEVMGDGPHLFALQELATEMNAPVKFITDATHEQKLERMCVCDMFVHASALESQPLELIEAMSRGSPCVVADAQGLGEVVHHGVTGLRCAGDAQSFAHVIQEVLADDDWRAMMGSSGARLAEASYGLAHVVEGEIAAHAKAMEMASERTRRAA
ncbi:MAG TPA: glycosyltransferase [Phycisphaerales bacterium]|nr:glycosyltransferase [Phycisphaerales bacterium]